MPEARDREPRGRAAETPGRSAAAGAAKAERPSSPAAETATGVVKPADEWRSGAAPVRPGRPRAHPSRATACAGPTPPLRFVGLRGRPRLQGFAGLEGRGPEARDGGRRGRAAEPPARAGGCRCREGRTTQLSGGGQPPDRAAEPPHETPSAAAPGSASGRAGEQPERRHAHERGRPDHASHHPTAISIAGRVSVHGLAGGVPRVASGFGTPTVTTPYAARWRTRSPRRRSAASRR